MRSFRVSMTLAGVLALLAVACSNAETEESTYVGRGVTYYGTPTPVSPTPTVESSPEARVCYGGEGCYCWVEESGRYLECSVVAQSKLDEEASREYYDNLRREHEQSTAANCDPSYPDSAKGTSSGQCIQVGAADYDCAGGSGNGPNYVRGPIRVLSPDPHRLDRDGDGFGCE